MFYISYFFECSALLTGLWLLKQPQHFSLKLLTILLLITVINEGFSYFGFYRSIGLNKTYAYETFFILQSLVFYLLFYNSLPQKKQKLATTVISIFLILCQIIALFIRGTNKLNAYFLNFVCIHMIFLGFIYYNHIYTINKVHKIYKDPFFWIATGMLIVNFIHLFFVNATLIKSFANNLASKSIFKSLNTFGNIFYYSLLIYSLICSSKFQKRATTLLEQP
jgi:hypothetical protein